MKPSMDIWLKEAKESEHAGKIGMYLTHNGVVRETSRAEVREGCRDSRGITDFRSGRQFLPDAGNSISIRPSFEEKDTAPFTERSVEGVFQERKQ